MRTKITIFAIGWLLAIGLSGLASPGYAQGLERPVNAPPTPAVSLAELAAKVNPSATAAGAARVYTNADLKDRPAPVAPTTPPFPEIAPPSGILEHPGVPIVQPVPEPAVEQYGVPYWDGLGFVGSPGFSSRGFRQPIRQGSVQLGISGRFSKPSAASDILLGPLNGRGAKGSRSGGRGGSHGGGRGGRGR